MSSKFIIQLVVLSNFLLATCFCASLTPSSDDRVSKLAGDLTRSLARHNKTHQAKALHYTPEALQGASEHLMKYINFSADPCEDFYEFACGKAKEEPKHEGLINELQIELTKRLIKLMTRNYTDDKSASSNQRRLQTVYNSCMNFINNTESEVDKIRNVTFRNIIENLGGLRAIGEDSSWTEGSSDGMNPWNEIPIKFRRLGLDQNVLFTVKIGPNLKNTSRYAIYIDFIHDEFSNIQVTHKIYQWISSVYPVNSKEDKLARDGRIDEAIFFKHDLLNVYQSADSKIDPDFKANPKCYGFDLNFENWMGKPFHRTTIAALQAETRSKKFDWKSYLSNLLRHELSSDEEIFVYKSKGYSYALDFIEKTDYNVVRDYMIFESISRQLGNFSPILSRATGSDPEKICSLMTVDSMGFAATIEYVREYFKPEARSKAVEMLNFVKSELESMINEADWIGDVTKVGALAKADTMVAHVGYPDQMLDDQFMDKFNEGIKLDDDNFFSNLFEINRWTLEREAKMLRIDTKSDSWRVMEMSLMVNSFYYNIYNSINLLPGLMHGFMFNSDQPNYINYAATGFVIGHEISHAFDSNCIRYDCHGDDICWWDKKTSENYLSKAKCIENQYDKIYGWVDGKNTLGENIADNVGLKMAHRAYEKWLQGQIVAQNQPDSSVEPLIPNVELSQEKLFWVSAAQFYCNSYSDDEIYHKFKDDPHSPPKLRVDIPMSNLVEFSDAFQCPEGKSKMNPVAKCQMW